ncbi:MAG: PEP-CTERM sorting domain-containing protein [Opitutaceae bacterium]|nr:PEP-CTERM sorting domain-containing protein [Opitutaceae bacterium]
MAAAVPEPATVGGLLAGAVLVFAVTLRRRGERRC